jgi:predicted Zn-dependent peptidase
VIGALLGLILILLPGNVTTFELENGTGVITRTIPGEVEGLSVFIIGGTRLRDAETQGLEAMALEAAMAGGGEFPGERWREVIDRTRAELTGSYNYDFSRLHLRCLAEDMPLLLSGLLQCLTEPELSETSVERARRHAVAQLSMQMVEPDDRVWLVANEGFMPAGHPYLLRPEGTVETVRSFTADQMRSLLEARIRGGNILVTHAGPTEPEELRSMLENSFGGLPPGADEPASVAPLGASRDTMIVREMDATTTYAVVKFKAPPAGHPDLPAFQAAMMVADELVWQVLRTDNALTYAAGAGVTTTYTENWGYMYVTTSSPHLACSLLTEVLRTVALGEVDPEMMRGVVRTQVTLDGIRAQTMDTQCWLMGAGAISAGHWSILFDAAQRFGNLTPPDISSAVRRWADTASWGIITGSPADLDITGPIPLGIHPMNEQGLVALNGSIQVLFPGSRSETVVLTDDLTGGAYALVGDRALRLIAQGASRASVQGVLSHEGWSVREELPRIMVTEVGEGL